MNFHRLRRQISEAISLSIPSDFDLELADVVPGKTDGHYIVVFQPLEAGADVDEGYAQIEEHRSAFVQAVAEEITRSTLPELSFRVSPKFDWNALRE